MIGAVVVHDDGAAGADELVHAFPGFDPRANAEGFELPDGAFEIPDKRSQKLFAVDGMPEEELREILMGTPAQESRKDFDEYDDEDADVLSIEDIKDMLSDEDGFDVEIRSPKKGVQVIYVLSEDPGRTRHLLKAEVLPDLGLDFIQPRKTKSTGFMLDIV